MTFFSEQIFEPQDVQINVDGVGRLEFPLSASVIAQLLGLTHPASYGRGKDTMLDASVRNTGEIDAARLDVRFADEALQRAMQVLAGHLELEASALEAPKLHNLLLYEKGQFFKPHQDSEKTPGMVASWVLVLPAPHIGGHLNINHGNQTHRMRSENVSETRIRCVGFYADCEHEVQRVEDGYRLALTFMIALKPQCAQLPPPDQFVDLNAPLSLQVRQHFAPGNEDRTMFVHYLDHQYTQCGLGWGTLKGLDRQLAQDLAALALQFDLTVHLALVEIQQSWTCFDEDEDPDELIDEGMSLDYWLDSNGNERAYGNQSAPSHALHWRTETGPVHLEHSEYEGFTGNAGNTMDYWYRRAAIVLWRTKDQPAFEFKFDPSGAWQTIHNWMQQTGHEAQVMQYLTAAGEAPWSGGAERMAKHLPHALEAAAYLGKHEAAQTMLQSVEPIMLDARCTKGLAALEQRYGLEWLRTRLDAWLLLTKKESFWQPPKWAPLDELVLAAKEVSLNEGIVLTLARCHVAAMINLDHQCSTYPASRLQTDALARIQRLRQILVGLCEIRSSDLGQSLSRHVLSHKALYPLCPTVDMLLTLIAENTAWSVVASELVQGLHEVLRDHVALPPRAADDWSLQLRSNCTCQLCTTVLAFAASHNERQASWPLAQPGRDHVIRQGREEIWPLSFSVVKQGSPHKLVMTKSPQLHEAQSKEVAEMDKRLTALNGLAKLDGQCSNEKSSSVVA